MEILYKKDDMGIVKVEVTRIPGDNLNGVEIGYTLCVEDTVLGISGELMFDKNGTAIRANHEGRDGISGDVSLMQWLNCYSGMIRNVMDQDSQKKYFPTKLPFGYAPTLSGCFLSGNREPIGNEKDRERHEEYI